MAILIALFLGLLASIIFTLPFRGRESRESSVVAVILIFIFLALAALAVQYWIMPFGPSVWGISLTAILIIVWLLATPSPYQKRMKGAKGEQLEEVKVAASISGFMWTLLVLLSAAALIGYYRTP